MTSTDDGADLDRPDPDAVAHDRPVEGAAVAPDGTPYFSQDGTGFVNVFRGLNGESVKNVFTRCCGYAESLAVDTTGLAQVAFFSNADPDGASVYEPLGADLSAGALDGAQADRRSTRPVPLVADHSGNDVPRVGAGRSDGDRRHGRARSAAARRPATASTFRGSFVGGDPHMALAVDPQDRLWVVWTRRRSACMPRARAATASTSARPSPCPVTGTMYQVSAVGTGGQSGHGRRAS